VTVGANLGRQRAAMPWSCWVDALEHASRGDKIMVVRWAKASNLVFEVHGGRATLPKRKGPVGGWRGARKREALH